MTKEEIIRTVTSYIDQSFSGLEIENQKCDFKLRWYDLTSKPDISEFLKDTSSIANTFGLDGLIIIGFDPKTKTYRDSTFKDCKLKDTSQIPDLINKHIDKLFELQVYDLEINLHQLSVLHIPPSLDKPHVIRNHQSFDASGVLKKEEQQKIFIRKGTATYPASKNDLEIMYYDRKNLILDYKLICSYPVKTLNFYLVSGQVRGNINLITENLGRRPVAIIGFEFIFSLHSDPSPDEMIKFDTGDRYHSSEVIIQPNQITGVVLNLVSYFGSYGFGNLEERVQEFEKSKRYLLNGPIILYLATGEKLHADLQKVGN